MEIPSGSPREKLNSRLRGKSGAEKLSLSDLGIAWNRHGGGIILPAERGGESIFSPGGVGHGTALEGMEWTVPLHRIREEVENAFHYPTEFLEEGIEGEVDVRLHLREGRVFRPESAQIKSQSPYLRVFILRILAKCLADPLPATYFRRGPLSIRLLFRFELTSKENPFYNPISLQEPPVVAGNSLYFERKGKLIGSWNLGPFAGYGIVPQIAINPEWLWEKAQELLGDKDRPDPLKKYREDPLF